MMDDQAVLPNIYNKDYFLKKCGGYEDFRKSRGKKLNIRLQKVFELADLKKGQKVLDIGCGRGELILHAALVGCSVFGVDYSKDAIALAKETVKDFSDRQKRKIKLFQADAKDLSFPKGTFDLIIMADFVEHLHDWELRIVFEKCYNFLKSGGRIVIHTAPNRWFTSYVYPLLRSFFWLQGRDLGHVRKNYPDSREHVNEHSPYQLKKELSERFLAKVWCENFNQATWVNKIPALRNFAVSIFAVAYKT
jgi:ubiquinone/menaquinone biosynthesis C-methylase UbiE